MRVRTLMIAVALLGAGCAPERELGSLSESEAATLYVTVKSELSKVHWLVLGGEPPREPFNYGCASGSIELRVGLDEDMQPETLSHTIDTCSIESGLTFDGAIDYRNLDRCGDDTPEFAFSAGGIVDLTGSMDGFCYIEVRDDCGTLTGHLCGFPAAKLIE